MFEGKAIEVRYRVALRDTAGHPAHAATHLRRRVILLDRDLLRNPREHRRILLHELFHFVWLRLGNQRRIFWENLLRNEWIESARGEAGWSAAWRKRELSSLDVRARTRRWREYCCESFCDTAAWIHGGDTAENTLAAKWRSARTEWHRRHILRYPT